jgi:serine protease AprX
MTRTIGLAERMRWFAVMGAIAALAAALSVATLANRGQLPTLQTSSPPAASRPPAGIGSSSPLDPRIAALAGRHPGQVVEAIVQFKGGVSVGRAERDVARVAGHVFGELHIINALAVKLPAERARWLAANPDVHAVSLNAEITPQSVRFGGNRFDGIRFDNNRRHDGHRSSLPTGNLQTTYDQTLGVTGLWHSGIDGAGVGVAVIDTGIDGNLPDFQSSDGQGSRVVESAVINRDATTATDRYGHGTDVAGIIAGDGNNLSASDPLKGQYIGVAPMANLVSIKVSDENGNATVLDVIYGLQFAVDHKSDYNIRVVNLSLDSDTPQSYTTDPLDAAAEAAWNHGIAVVAAAGNRGTDPDAVQYAPANDPYVITVGAVDESGTAVASDDTIPDWSSQGTTQDGFQKPDVYAPGAHIVSVLAPGSAFASMCPSCTIGGDYIVTSGTSMAAAAISGLAADVLQAHPGWTPDQLKTALTSAGVSANSAIQEPYAPSVVALSNPIPADQGLTPNDLINPTTGGIDYSRSSWSRSSWSVATGGLSAGFARSSWSCACSSASTTGPPGGGNGNVDSSRSSWSRSSWSTYFDTTEDAG